tara:strand:- start:12205 stop:13683 length:1479 start_codon:yes stop_codon:yes gene_type:complete
MLLETLKKHAKSKIQNNLFIAINENYYSFKKIDDLVNKTCNYFENLGLKKRDKICTSIDNSLTYILLYFASMRYGLIINPSPTYLSKNQFIKNIDQIKPKVIFVEQKIFSKKSKIIKIDNDDIFLNIIFKYNKNYKNKKKILPKDVAVLYYSSGSTGSPKLIAISHKAIFETQKMQENSTLKYSGNNHLCILPLAHTSSLRSTLKFCLYNGRSVFLYKNFWTIKDRFFEIIYKNKITFVQVVPSILNMLIQIYSKNKNLHKKTNSLKFLASGSAFLSEKIKNKFKNNFNVPIINIYGLSETCAITMTKLNKNNDISHNSIGQVLKGIKFKIIDGNNKKVKNNVPGELVIKSPSLFSGYYNTKSRKAYFTKDNYFKTGDIVTSNNKSELKYIERKKNIVIKSGININCREIDDYFMSLNYIKDAYTTSKPDLFHGEVPISFVVLKFKKRKDKIISDIKKHLGDFKIPSEISVLKKIPRSQTGKIQYFLLNKND